MTDAVIADSRVAAARAWLNRHTVSMYASILTTLLMIAAMSPYIFVDVPAGSVGVLWRRFGGGTVTDKIRAEGFHMIFPWDVMNIYDTRMQNDTNSYQAIAANGMMLSVEVAVRFRVNPPGAGLLHKLAGPGYLDTLVHPKMKSLVLEFVSQRDPEEFYSFRRMEIQEYLNKSSRAAFETPQQQFFGDEDGDGIQGDMDGVGIPMIRVEEVMISRVVLPPLVQTAIDRKIEQQQIMQEYDYRLAREQKERDRKRIEAEGIRDFQDTVAKTITMEYLRLRGIETTRAFADSPNAKTIIIGGRDGLPIILNTGDDARSPAPPTAVQAAPSLMTPVAPLETRAPGGASADPPADVNRPRDPSGVSEPPKN